MTTAANDVTYSCESGDVYDAGESYVMMQRDTPDNLVLGQNYPNPFNPVTRIEFGMPTPGHVRLDVYNVKGELVANLANGTYGTGFHTVDVERCRYVERHLLLQARDPERGHDEEDDSSEVVPGRIQLML